MVFDQFPMQARSRRLVVSAGGTLVVGTAHGPLCEALTKAMVSTPLSPLLILVLSIRTAGRCLSWARTWGCVLRGNHRRLAEVRRRGGACLRAR